MHLEGVFKVLGQKLKRFLPTTFTPSSHAVPTSNLID
ncbi:hypothetical protein cce_0163 [Crocosphaera subtropica ATCC 51142]|uniref:Uncharacterized protein n=1 Tax=Crocosphaera subtropica (strain ATCC 51142 / BH68) TaxID=43989 RepID=B1WZE9_CROS5|nr:hypothetical protein cce_0163 [Crocosphaera subtropica ATCC 51142]